jgi:hypothetical protein
VDLEILQICVRFLQKDNVEANKNDESTSISKPNVKYRHVDRQSKVQKWFCNFRATTTKCSTKRGLLRERLKVCLKSTTNSICQEDFNPETQYGKGNDLVKVPAPNPPIPM